jgi:hypothetical protein
MDDLPDRGSPARVVLVSGHLVDGPDRPAARFPPARVAWVTARVADALDAWRVGPGTTLVCGGARGADIIAAEQAYARGAAVLLCLALPAEDFARRSVDLPGTSWADRFRDLLTVADVRQLAAEVTDVPDGDEVFARTNAWMVDTVRAMDDRPYVVVVWDGRGGDGPGGTGDLVRRLGYAPDDERVRVIDPTPA